MVKSILDPTVTYNETSEIDPMDLDYNANLYETIIYEKTIIFALGKPKYTYLDNNIVYYSIYWVEKEEISMQIGVYEILASEQENIFDNEGDIDLNKFDKPLLFSFTYSSVAAAEPSVEAAAEAEPSVVEQASVAAKASVAAEASIAAEASTVKNKTNKKKNKWIQQFMASEQYDIIDTPYDGNCFFSMVKLALEENNQELSIDDMRDILVKNVTEELFQNYKELYDNYLQNEANITREIKNITKRHKDLTATMKKTKDRNLVMSFEKQSTEIEKLHGTLKKERNEVREILQEYAFMKGIDNLSMLKLKIKTNEYWADTWAISTLERELNIKMIIFSELNYREADEVNVLQCGQLNDTILEERGIFEPSFYILAAYHGGYHYQMITFSNHRSFSFEELPEEVRQLVAEKCLEKIAGPYSLIPEFKAYALRSKNIEPIVISSENESEASQNEASQNEASQNEASQNEASQNEASQSEASQSESSKEPVPEQPVPEPPMTEELSSDLYDSGTVLRFYSQSLGKPRPGKGAGEILGPEGANAYEELARIPDWRKKLANSWPAEFKLDNHTWLTAEHYYQASKFKRNNKDFYIQFSLDSRDSSIAKDAEMAKAAGSKSGKFKGELLRTKNIMLDPDFYQKPTGVKYSRGEIEMEAAMRAKFTQHPDLKQLLLATKKAKLEHIRRGAPAEVFKDLMRVRRELKDAV
jgi:predicted NAD-dependent protein-ADP-ribosyltransferase YbiA (DUF1768 family)